ncbi:MAG: hypothetical protein GY851_14215 [bacterium]|nr:hypothetical protein [bacterium]
MTHGSPTTMLAMILVCCAAVHAAETDKAIPKADRTVAPPLSANLPAEYAALPVFGSIDWETRRLPWVGPGPDEGVSGLGMVPVDGKLYLTGGFIPGGDESGDEVSHRTSRWTWRYDPASDTWDRLADAPIRREYVRSIATSDSVYLVGGGCQYKGQNPPYRVHGECARLDLKANPSAWSTCDSLNVPRTHTAVGCIGRHLVVAGGNEYDLAEKGYSHATIRATTEVFDTSDPDGGWREAKPLPGAGRGWSASVTTDAHLYVFSGLTWDESNDLYGTPETLRYEPAADTWDKLAPPPLAMSGWEGALYADRFAIIVGGVERRVGAKIGWSDLVWAYDIQDNQWLRVNGLLPPGAVFNDPGVAIVGDTIYVAGAEGPYGSHYNYFLVGRIRRDS